MRSEYREEISQIRDWLTNYRYSIKSIITLSETESTETLSNRRSFPSFDLETERCDPKDL